MLLPDLYTIKHFSFSEGTVNAEIVINSTHEIFKGHFPGNPILPGVCSLEIVKELIEKAINKKLTLSVANNVKFMAVINPDKTPQLKIVMDIAEVDDIIKIKNVTSFGDTIAIKMSAHYKIN